MNVHYNFGIRIFLFKNNISQCFSHGSRNKRKIEFMHVMHDDYEYALRPETDGIVISDTKYLESPPPPPQGRRLEQKTAPPPFGGLFTF